MVLQFVKEGDRYMQATGAIRRVGARVINNKKCKKAL